MKLLNIAGFKTCGAYQKAKTVLGGLTAIFPSKYSVNIVEYETRDEYMAWLEGFRATINADNHKTSPIVWFDKSSNSRSYLGGRDDTIAWCRSILSAPANASAEDWSVNIDSEFTKDHGYDYDLVVIGGGSGGLACSKEAVNLGAKVAVLDFVKPSPHGSKWGLGGTCVNVGCIPKKLMHQAGLLGEASKDAKGFGWTSTKGGAHSWETLRENVQDHIKGLNFGYRVQLREKGVTYMNKLGRFTGPHNMEVTDSKGRKQNISAARFVIATGGRPTPLNFPGAEHAITSDDIFMREKPPGKTCVIGAGYVALECAGFITSLNSGNPENSVTVLCRSVPLRTFDQDTVKYITDFMKHQGTNIVEGVLPQLIEQQPDGRFRVTYGGKDHPEVTDVFDTVLQAVGRTPDLAGLELSALHDNGIKLDDRSGKIICTNEQTSVPYVYAIGDVVHDSPELTPVAILAGKLLARRLFGDSSHVAAASGEDLTICYKNIPTAVFTPLELGTVGLTEKEAQEMYGEDAIDSYISGFTPLEWTITENHTDLSAYAKVVVNKQENERVLGMHIAAPNAGEIIQGYGLALKKGLYFKELTSMVGVHPTVGEEFTVLNVTKSSGASAAKTGC